MPMSPRAALAGLALVPALLACGDDGGGDAPPDVHFDLDADTSTFATFWDLPFPSDLRTNPDGTLDLAGYPNQRQAPLIDDLLEVARLRIGAPLMPVTWVRFGAHVEVPERRHTDVIAAEPAAPILLIDVDPDSPEQGRLFPVVAETLVRDDFAPPTLVAIAPRPGIVLAPDTTYAVVLRRAVAPDAEPPPDFVALQGGTVDAPDDSRAARAVGVYAPLWPALDALGVPADDVLVATVFTTGDETRRVFDRGEAIRAAHDAVIADLAIDPDDGADHDGFCELVGTVTQPMFQRGTAPYASEGDFELDADGVPVMQGTVTLPLVITIPAGEMPASGWPLIQVFHGSGGRSNDVVDRTYEPPAGQPDSPLGWSYAFAHRGIAAASSAMPVNPERYPPASAYEYLNINNLSAFPWLFEQGVIEQRLLLDALLALEIAPATLAGCPEVTLPAGATAHVFDPGKLGAAGQSMGGMYANLVGAVEPRFAGLMPTAAGGMWNLMIIATDLIPGAVDLLAAAFATDFERLNFMHPGIALLGLGWETAEPMMAMSRLARRPLDAPGFAPRHVYEPVGYGDVYFAPLLYDAAALAYGNVQAGEVVWPEMQDALALDDLDGIAAYPVSGNRTRDGVTTTNVVVQYEGDGIRDPHYIAFQREEVIHQYGCFFETLFAGQTPVIVAPGAWDDPCSSGAR